jgi:hypothetical protein
MPSTATRKKSRNSLSFTMFVILAVFLYTYLHLKTNPANAEPAYVILKAQGRAFHLDTIHNGLLYQSLTRSVEKADSQYILYKKNPLLPDIVNQTLHFHEPMDTLIVPDANVCRIVLENTDAMEIWGGSTIAFTPPGNGDPDTSKIYLTKGEISLAFHSISETHIGNCIIRNMPSLDNTFKSLFKIKFDSPSALQIVPYHGIISVFEDGRTYRIDSTMDFKTLLGYISSDSNFNFSNSSLDNGAVNYVVDLKGKKITQVLQELCNYYGIKGYKCAADINKNEIGLLGTNSISTNISLSDLLRYLSTQYQVHLKLDHDTIFISRKPFVAPMPEAQGNSAIL